MSALRRARWNAYGVGAAIGVLSWVVFAVVDAPLGMSTAISEVSGATAKPFMDVSANPYWKKTVPAWDYGMLFLIGTFAGALVSALLARDFKLETVPQVWRDRFGPAGWKRLLGAFAGGVLVLYGARMAGGCTSGHGISGSLQLAVSSWIFFLTMFVFGVVTAGLMFGLRGSRRAGGAS
jgi:uncharacterized protein